MRRIDKWSELDVSIARNHLAHQKESRRPFVRSDIEECFERLVGQIGFKRVWPSRHDHRQWLAVHQLAVLVVEQILRWRRRQ